MQFCVLNKNIHICHSKTMSHLIECLRYCIHTNIIHIIKTQNSIFVIQQTNINLKTWNCFSQIPSGPWDSFPVSLPVLSCILFIHTTCLMQKKIRILLRIVLLNVLGLSLSGLQLNLQVEDYACLKLWASLLGCQAMLSISSTLML
jgi:hypothetical protein